MNRVLYRLKGGRLCWGLWLLLALQGLGLALHAQGLALDSTLQAKIKQHRQLSGEARFRSAIELAKAYLIAKGNTGQDGPLAQVYHYLHEARQLGRRLGQPPLESEALFNLAHYHFRWRHADSLQQTLVLLQDLNRRASHNLSRLYIRRTEVYLAEAQADTQRLWRACHALIAQAQRENMPNEVKSSRQFTVDAATRMGNWRLAIEQDQLLIEVDLAAGDYAQAGNRYEGLHRAYMRLDRPDSAQLMIREAFRWHLRSPDRQHYAGFLLRMGNHYTSAGQHRKAIACFYNCQGYFDSLFKANRLNGHPDAPQNAIDVATVRGNMAGNYLNLNELDSSAYWLHRAHHPMLVMQSSVLDTYINFQLAQIHYKLNRADSALMRIDSARMVLGEYLPKRVIMHFCVHLLRGAIHNRFNGLGSGRADLLLAYTYLQDIRRQFPEADNWLLFQRLEFFRLAWQELERLGDLTRAINALEYYALLRQKMQVSQLYSEQIVVSEFEITSRERQIEVLNLQQELDRQHQQRQYLYLGGVLLLVLLALGFAWTWVRRSRDRQQQNRLLTAQNQTLEAQNAELEAASHELRTAVSQLNDQRLLLDRRQSHLDRSLHFATVIQRQFLGNRQHLSGWAGDHALFYAPRDEVSGDFYWWRQQGNRLRVAVIDCTGHGVPGALMSVLAFHLLEDWFEHHAENSPSQALHFLDDAVRHTLKQERAETALDGMDVAFIDWNLASGEVVCAGARRDIWLRRGGSWQRIEATRRSIGGRSGPEALPFGEHRLQLETGDRLFAFTDGVSDQFGGPRRRKLGTKALLAELATYDGLSLAEAEARFAAFFAQWRGAQAQLDDALLLGLAVNPLTFVHGT